MKDFIKEKKTYILVAILVLQLIGIVFLDFSKAGYHVDEIFTFELSNYPGTFVSKTQNSYQWLPGEFFSDALTPKGNEFNYEIPYHNQDKDVHPPLYYFIIHTISSLSPGAFSPWFGFIPNIIFKLLSSLVLFLLFEKISGNTFLSLSITAFYALGVAGMSFAVLIRMYSMLTFLGLINMLVHISFVKKLLKKDSPKPLSYFFFFLITLSGVLTHYHFYVYSFFLCGAFFFFLLFSKQWKTLFLYVISQFSAVGLALLFFPSAIYHMFKGHRGKQAVDYLFSYMNIWLPILIGALLLCVAFIILNKVYFHLSLRYKDDIKAVILRFFTIKGKEKEIKLSLPDVFAFFITIICSGFVGVVFLSSELRRLRYYELVFPYVVMVGVYVLYRFLGWAVKNKKISCALFIAALLILLPVGYNKHKNLNLYPENKALIEAVKPYYTLPAIILNNESYNGAVSQILPVFANHPEVFIANIDEKFDSLSTAGQSSEINNGFVFYIIKSEWSEEELYEMIGEHIPISEIEKLFKGTVSAYLIEV